MHTPLCGHALGEPVEYVRKAAESGLGLITFTCHIPMTDSRFGAEGIRMNQSQMAEYNTMVDAAKEVGDSLGVEVLRGIEAEVFPDESLLDDMDAVLAAGKFDFVLGSLHHHLRIYREWLSDNGIEDDAEIIRTYFTHLQRGIESGRYHSIAHPDLIRIYDTVKPFAPELYEAEIRAVLASAREYGVCLEVNTSGLAKGVFELHPAPVILDWVVAEQVSLTLGSDAHKPENVGRFFDSTRKLLREKGIQEIKLFRRGTPENIKL